MLAAVRQQIQQAIASIRQAIRAGSVDRATG
jgi:hypothetical protein